MRMSRRLGLVGGLKLPSLYEFWSDASIITVTGYGSSTGQSYSSRFSVGSTDTPLWVIASKGDWIETVKISNNSIERLNYYVAPTGDASIVIFIDDTISTTATTQIYVGSSGTYYGYAVAALRFPSFSESIVDAVFKKINIQFDTNGYHHGSTTSTIYIADSDLSNDTDDVYLQMIGSGTSGYISATRGGTPVTAILTNGTRPYWRHNNSRYYATIIGTNNVSLYAGGLYRLYI